MAVPRLPRSHVRYILFKKLQGCKRTTSQDAQGRHFVVVRATLRSADAIQSARILAATLVDCDQFDLIEVCKFLTYATQFSKTMCDCRIHRRSKKTYVHAVPCSSQWNAGWPPPLSAKDKVKLGANELAPAYIG